MHLLLPPSEAKNPGGRGRPLATRLETDPGPVAEGRRTVLSALERLIAGDRAEAAAALLLPPAVVDSALAANATAASGPTTPALSRYAGVVYDGLDASAMDTPTRKQAGRRVLIMSGLLGVVRGDEPVPDYRVPAKAVLPGVGVAGTYWRPLLDEAIPGMLGRGLIVDLRSSDYAAMWRPTGPLKHRVVTVRVLSPAPRGGYAVISHTSKLMKGRLAAALLRRCADGDVPTDATAVLDAWSSVGGLRAERTQSGGVELYTRTSTG